MFTDWVLLALLASALGGFSIILDKVLLTRYTKDWIYLTAFLGIINFTPLLLFPFFVNPLASAPTILFGLSVGIFARVAIFFYMKAISIEEASRVVPLWLASPFFVLAMARLFLGEQLLPVNYAGFVAVIAGSAMIMTARVKGLLRLRPAFYVMMISNFVFAFSEIFMKYASAFSGFLPLVFWAFAGSALASIPVALFKLRQKHELFYRKDRFLLVLPLGAVLYTAAVGIYLYAISLGPVSLVSTLGSTDGVFVFIYAIFLTKFAPSFVKEAVDRKTLLTKALAIAVIIAGVFLINRGV